MNTIKLEIPFNSKNVELVKDLLSRATMGTDAVKAGKLEVVQDEDEPVKKTSTAKPRPSRAKPKPVEEPEEDEDDEEYDPLAEDDTEEDEDGITLDDIKAVMADKVDKNRDTILKKLKATGAAKIGDLKEAKFEEFYNFLKKLK